MRKYYKELIIWGIVILIIASLLLLREEDCFFYVMDKNSYQLENVTISSIEAEVVGAGGTVVKRDFVVFKYENMTEMKSGRLRKAFDDYIGKKITVGINQNGKCVRIMPIVPSICGYSIEILVIFSLGIFLIIYGSLPHKEHEKSESEIKRDELSRKINFSIRIVTLLIVIVMILIFMGN